MGNWVGVYRDEPDMLSAAIGSKSDAKLAAVLAANPGLGQEHRAALRRLVDGDFVGGEQPGGGSFVYAFEAICRACAIHRTTVEIYVSDDAFPEIWAFVWDAAEVPQHLPQSERGSPAVGYWDVGSVRNAIDVLSRLDLDVVAERNNGRMYEDEIAEIIAVLEAAHQVGRGVYVFYNE
jgi:hypothetical protein